MEFVDGGVAVACDKVRGGPVWRVDALEVGCKGGCVRGGTSGEEGEGGGGGEVDEGEKSCKEEG